MKFLANSTNEKYTRRLNSYGREKLEKPLVRHKFDSDNVTIRTDLEDVGTSIQLKVVVMIPGEAKQEHAAKNARKRQQVEMAGAAPVAEHGARGPELPKEVLELRKALKRAAESP